MDVDSIESDLAKCVIEENHDSSMTENFHLYCLNSNEIDAAGGRAICMWKPLTRMYEPQAAYHRLGGAS